MSNPNDYLYPDVSVQNLRFVEVMRRLHKEHPDYFTNQRCPYPNEVERYFRSWFDTSVRPAGRPAGRDMGADYGDSYDPRADALLGEDKWDALYREVVELYASLKNAKPSAGDSSESMAYFRTATGLLDKLVGHQERCLGIKQVAEFHKVVLDIMEGVLSEDQRNKVMSLLKDSIKN